MVICCIISPCVDVGRPLSALNCGLQMDTLSLLVVSVFVLQARPMVQREHTVGERARITPTTQTGLEKEREGEGRQRVSLIQGVLRGFALLICLREKASTKNAPELKQVESRYLSGYLFPWII